MLPDPKDEPAQLGQGARMAIVPGAILFDLVRPPGAIPLWDSKVDRATMPEAAVDENADSCANEDEIGDGTERRYGPPILEVAQATTM